MEKTVLNLKIPVAAHRKIKGFAVNNGEKLIPFATQLIIDAAQNEEALNEALKNIREEKKDE